VFVFGSWNWTVFFGAGRRGLVVIGRRGVLGVDV